MPCDENDVSKCYTSNESDMAQMSSSSKDALENDRSSGPAVDVDPQSRADSPAPSCQDSCCGGVSRDASVKDQFKDNGSEASCKDDCCNDDVSGTEARSRSRAVSQETSCKDGCCGKGESNTKAESASRNSCSDASCKDGCCNGDSSNTKSENRSEADSSDALCRDGRCDKDSNASEKLEMPNRGPSSTLKPEVQIGCCGDKQNCKCDGMSSTIIPTLSLMY